MKYERILYGEIQLDEQILRENNIYHNMELEYYKIKNNNENKMYGIEIVKREYINNEIQEENKYIKELTKSEETVENLLEKLKKNIVTPTSLEYIITDMFK